MSTQIVHPYSLNKKVSHHEKYYFPASDTRHDSWRLLSATSKMFVKSFYIPPAAMANMLILFYLFCSGKMEDNLAGIFNLFDQDGNKVAR